MTQQSLIKEKGVLRVNGITSGQILSLLRDRHSKDVMVPECKNGETWGARDLLKLDAWVLRRSYSPLTTIGYEIKTSRQDFERDQKWTGYLDLCHQFYFVCPAGLIRATDLPQRVGIIWVSKSGTLRAKRKAERVNPDMEKLNRLLLYVLMARSDIVDSMYDRGREPPKDRLQQLRETVEGANEKNELAYFIKGHVQQIYSDTLKKSQELKYREDTIKKFEERLALLGITWDSTQESWQDNSRVESEIDLLKKRIDYRTLEAIKRMGQNLTSVAEMIEHYRKVT